MTWLADVIRALENLGGTTTYDELYAEVKKIATRPLPQNYDAIVRRTVEEYSSDSKAFKDKGNYFYSVEGIGKGKWGLRRERAEEYLNGKTESYDLTRLEIGRDYTSKEIEKIFGHGFGTGPRGINPGEFPDGTKFVIIFSKANGPYPDHLEGDTLMYQGEGRDRDQTYTHNNKVLGESNKENRYIFGFRQITPGVWYYLGQLELMDYEYVNIEGRKVIEFELLITNITSPVEEYKELSAITAPELPVTMELTDEVEKKDVTTKKTPRSSVFQKIVKEYYKSTCAVCGKKRFTRVEYPEVEAAHIYPRSLKGKDTIQNGIALCKLHHWAFDGGLFSINDDHTIAVFQAITTNSNYTEISNYDGAKIMLPENVASHPHPVFLKAHRELHGFQ